MGWRLFGDLRSALAAHDWQRVAGLMDGYGGCEDEAARFYAHAYLMALPDHQRPFRIAVGAGKVGRSSLKSTASVDIARAMVRKNVYGPSYTIAPLYGFTAKAVALKGWTGWNSEPVPMRDRLGAARLEVLLRARRGEWTPTGTTGEWAFEPLVTRAIKALCDVEIGASHHAGEQVILRELERMGHPRIKEQRSQYGNPSVITLDGVGEPWLPSWQNKATEILISAVGNEITSALHFRVEGGWQHGEAQVTLEDDMRVLTTCGALRAQLLRGAGVWLVPSPHVDGQPVRVETTEQVEVLTATPGAAPGLQGTLVGGVP